MPPAATWYRGHEAICQFLESGPLSHSWQHRPARANGQVAVDCYLFDPVKDKPRAAVIDCSRWTTPRLPPLPASWQPIFSLNGPQNLISIALLLTRASMGSDGVRTRFTDMPQGSFPLLIVRARSPLPPRVSALAPSGSITASVTTDYPTARWLGYCRRSWEKPRRAGRSRRRAGTVGGHLGNSHGEPVPPPDLPGPNIGARNPAEELELDNLTTAQPDGTGTRERCPPIDRSRWPPAGTRRPCQQARLMHVVPARLPPAHTQPPLNHSEELPELADHGHDPAAPALTCANTSPDRTAVSPGGPRADRRSRPPAGRSRRPAPRRPCAARPSSPRTAAAAPAHPARCCPRRRRCRCR
jgi:hypothetical protein